MPQGDAGIQHGCLVIADITGYTAFLSHSELEHAQDSLRSLLEVILSASREALVVSKLEGDAVFSYALAGSFIQGQSVVEAIERIYIAFARALERMVLNTTCACNACRNIPNLDLKFFVHYGSFALQRIAGRPELVGNDVVLLHRLTKNTIAAGKGLKAYAAYTQAAVTGLDLAEFAATLQPHHETYEHLGEVTLYVQDMRAVWEAERRRVHYSIPDERATLRYELDFPVPPALLWDYLTDPYYRGLTMGSSKQSVKARERGRTGPGSIYQCAHGKRVFNHTVLEWHPFEEYTFDSTLPFLKGLAYRFTCRLTPTPQGTRCTVLGAPSQGSRLKRVLGELMVRLPPTIADTLKRFRKEVAADMAQRKQGLAQSPPAGAEELAAEVRAALAGNTQAG